MDDLVTRGAAGLIGIYLVIFLLLLAIYFVARLMYISFVAGDSGFVLGGAGALLVALASYMAIGCWLRKTGRI